MNLDHWILYVFLPVLVVSFILFIIAAAKALDIDLKQIFNANRKIKAELTKKEYELCIAKASQHIYFIDNDIDKIIVIHNSNYGKEIIFDISHGVFQSKIQKTAESFAELQSTKKISEKYSPFMVLQATP